MTGVADDEIARRHDLAVAAGEPSYVDPATGYQVFTSQYLLGGGTCCDSLCRHCPYRDTDPNPELP